MATRCNVHIIKGSTTIQLYHHYDGYPEGVGTDLENYIKEIKKLEISNELLSSASKLGKWLCDEDRDDTYEYEGKTKGTHGDIEYLYKVNLNKNTITCYKVKYETWGFEDAVLTKEYTHNF